MVRKKKARTWSAQLTVLAFLFLSVPMVLIFNMNTCFADTDHKLVEELSPDEKTGMIKELLAEGDQYVKEKNYNLANTAYESIFLLDPQNIRASQKIDQLKKHMMKEGKSETDLVTRVYDSEIDIRVKTYLKDAKEFMAQGKIGQARLTLQKALLINPLSEEASKLYKQIEKED